MMMLMMKDGLITAWGLRRHNFGPSAKLKSCSSVWNDLPKLLASLNAQACGKNRAKSNVSTDLYRLSLPGWYRIRGTSQLDTFWKMLFNLTWASLGEAHQGKLLPATIVVMARASQQCIKLLIPTQLAVHVVVCRPHRGGSLGRVRVGTGVR